MAAMIATSSTAPATCSGSRYSVNASRPSAAVLPPRGAGASARPCQLPCDSTNQSCSAIATATTTAAGRWRQKPERARSMLMSSIITTNRNSTITAPTYTRISTIARNSARSCIHRQADEKKASTRNNTACTGLRAVITRSPASSVQAANTTKSMLWVSISSDRCPSPLPLCPQWGRGVHVSPLPLIPPDGSAEEGVARRAPSAPQVSSTVCRIGGARRCDLLFIAVADREQHLLGVNQIAPPLPVILQDVRFDDRIDRTAFFAESAEYALGQVDVVARRAPRAVGPLLRLDRDRQRRAHCLAQLAGDAALLAVLVAPQRVQPAKARRHRRLLLRVLDRDLAGKQVPPGQCHPLEQLAQQQRVEEVADRPNRALAHGLAPAVWEAGACDGDAARHGFHGVCISTASTTIHA